jgi:hypothetical protein
LPFASAHRQADNSPLTRVCGNYKEELTVCKPRSNSLSCQIPYCIKNISGAYFFLMFYSAQQMIIAIMIPQGWGLLS